uniref:Tom-1 n=1 Tax=Pristionchus pacificus TaxID=54126 RepID=A0A2A6BKB0_PRIPA|eukprot:PDM66339.1 tom-1 [Pristionchus pacificus]
MKSLHRLSSPSSSFFHLPFTLSGLSMASHPHPPPFRPLPPHFRSLNLHQLHHVQQESSLTPSLPPSSSPFSSSFSTSSHPSSMDPSSLINSSLQSSPQVYESFTQLGMRTQPEGRRAQSVGRRLVDRGDGRGDEEDDYEGKESKDRGVVSLLFGGCFSACQRMSLSEHGLGIYMASPSEMEKYTVCAELAEQASESMGELFVPTEVTDPNGAVNGGNGGGAGSFLKGIFSGVGTTPRGAGPTDLDAILADKPGHSGTSGSVAMRTVGRTIPGPARIDRAATGSVSAGQAAAMALQNLNERSEKLNATVDATENLKNSAMNMASRSAKLVEKMEKKKWYNF